MYCRLTRKSIVGLALVMVAVVFTAASFAFMRDTKRKNGTPTDICGKYISESSETDYFCRITNNEANKKYHLEFVTDMSYIEDSEEGENIVTLEETRGEFDFLPKELEEGIELDLEAGANKEIITGYISQNMICIRRTLVFSDTDYYETSDVSDVFYKEKTNIDELQYNFKVIHIVLRQLAAVILVVGLILIFSRKKILPVTVLFVIYLLGITGVFIYFVKSHNPRGSYTLTEMAGNIKGYEYVLDINNSYSEGYVLRFEKKMNLMSLIEGEFYDKNMNDIFCGTEDGWITIAADDLRACHIDYGKKYRLRIGLFSAEIEVTKEDGSRIEEDISYKIVNKNQRKINTITIVLCAVNFLVLAGILFIIKKRYYIRKRSIATRPVLEAASYKITGIVYKEEAYVDFINQAEKNIVNSYFIIDENSITYLDNCIGGVEIRRCNNPEIQSGKKYKNADYFLIEEIDSRESLFYFIRYKNEDELAIYMMGRLMMIVSLCKED